MIAQKPELIVGGERLGDTAGDLEWVTCWPGGTESITFDVTVRSSIFVTGALVEVDCGGIRLACGRLKQPVRGDQLKAEGLHRLGEDWTAFSPAYNPSWYTDEAVDFAISRGLPWKRIATIGGGAFVPADGRVYSVAQLLDIASTQVAKTWGILPDRTVRFEAPQAPTLHISTDLDGLAPTLDGYASVLYGRYNDSSTGTWQTISWEDKAASARWGRVEHTFTEPLLDGAPMGIIQAGAYLAGLLKQGRAEIGWTQPIEVQYGDVFTEYGQPVEPWRINARRVAQLHNVRSAIADIPGGTTVDMRLGRTRHTDYGRSALLDPLALSSPMEKALAGI